MKINVAKLVPKEWRVKKIDNDLIRVANLSRARGWTNRKSIILKKLIPVTEDFIAGIAMYLGDGKLGKDPHLAYVSKDKDISLFMLRFFEEHVLVNRETMSFALTYGTDSEIESWSEYLQLPINKIRYYRRERVKCPTLTIQIGSVILRELFSRIIEVTLRQDIVNNKELRRAFLRGLFAAEGSIGVCRTEKPRPYIAAISYHFHAREINLINYCCKCLDAESIRYKVVRRSEKRGNATDIIITKWENYWKLWKAKVFDLCERKRETFLDISRQAAFRFLLDEEFRYNLLDSTKLLQRKLAKKLGTYQASVCGIKQGRFLLSLEQLDTLAKLTNTDMSRIKENISHSKISTTYIKDPKFLDFIYELKLV